MVDTDKTEIDYIAHINSDVCCKKTLVIHYTGENL